MQHQNIVLIDKPYGLSSNDAINQIKRACGYKKIGHSGTLDPMATGLLVVGINNGTKKLNNYQLDNKQYEAKIKFGVRTTTGDKTGNIINEIKTHKISIGMINVAIDKFINFPYYQRPHPFSAIKINGKKAYEYAREGKFLQLQKRLVKIHKLKIIDFYENTQILSINLLVSKGFYVRSFAEDLANEMKNVGHLVEIRRIACGKFNINDSLKLDEYIKIYGKN